MKNAPILKSSVPNFSDEKTKNNFFALVFSKEAFEKRYEDVEYYIDWDIKDYYAYTYVRRALFYFDAYESNDFTYEGYMQCNCGFEDKQFKIKLRSYELYPDGNHKCPDCGQFTLGLYEA